MLLSSKIIAIEPQTAIIVSAWSLKHCVRFHLHIQLESWLSDIQSLSSWWRQSRCWTQLITFALILDFCFYLFAHLLKGWFCSISRCRFAEDVTEERVFILKCLHRHERYFYDRPGHKNQWNNHTTHLCCFVESCFDFNHIPLRPVLMMQCGGVRFLFPDWWGFPAKLKSV